MKIVEFECQKCKKVQEKWLKRLNSENTERCEYCNSSPEELRRCMYRPKHEHHMSWSKWKV